MAELAASAPVLGRLPAHPVRDSTADVRLLALTADALRHHTLGGRRRLEGRRHIRLRRAWSL